MRKLFTAFFAFILSLLWSVNMMSQQNNQFLTLDEWMVSKANRELWFPVKVPATLHPAMHAAGRIPDPFKGDIEERLQFIGLNDWTYKTTIRISPEQLKASQILLEFQGLDTYADIYINRKKTFTTDNMFRSWEFDIKPFVQAGDNEIELLFHAPLEYSVQHPSAYKKEFPGGQRVWTRKAQFQFGWDWAPAYLSMGIWKPVLVKFVNRPYIKSNRLSYQLGKNTANVIISAEIFSPSKENYRIESRIAGQHQDKRINLHEGLNTVEMNFTIDRPLLWWPNGMGDQNLYDYSIGIGKKHADEEVRTGKAGFRTAELITQQDKQGESFYFRINGKPVFAKGANYVPSDAFPEQVSDEKLYQLLMDARNSNFNMLRVWGGGIYECDRFYQLCDSLGIMVWQDFMFACAMYPGEAAFLDNVKKEAEENVRRIAVHPSVVLWCGNNENAEGWARWGWQDGLSRDEKDYLETAYDRIFAEILPEAVRNHGQGVPYWESSPKFGRGDIRHRFEGDAHYWGVWHDGEDFSKYEEKVPRFMSEFGFQSYPEMSTIKYFSGRELRQDEPSMLAHQKHPRGNELIGSYIRREFDPKDDFESFVYLSQVVQAEGVGRGIAAQRSAMPFCMGSLYWQFNDCWPAISWSSIDYFGRWKPLQYKARTLFQPVVINTLIQNDKLVSNLVSDIDSSLNLELETGCYTLSGDELFTQTKSVTAEPVTSSLVYTRDISADKKKYGAGNICYVSRLKNAQGKLIAEDIDFAALPMGLALEKGKLSYTVREIPEGYKIVLVSEAVNPGVFITTDLNGSFSDNYFTMMRGSKEIIFHTTEPARDMMKAFRIMTWADAVH